MNDEHSHELRSGVLVALLTYILWGVLTIYWKQLHHFDAFELIGWRVVTSAAVMAIVLSTGQGWREVIAALRQPRTLGTVCVSAVFLVVNWTSYVWAVVHGKVLETALGYFIAPLGTVAVGVMLLHEPMRRAQKVAVVLAIASVGLLTVSYGRVPLMALLIALSWTLYGYMKRRVSLTPVVGMSTESFVLLLPAIAVVTILAGHQQSIPHDATGVEWAYVLGTGVATVVPLILFAWAAKRVPLTVIGPMQYLVPSINFVIGWLMYGESMPAERLVGFSLVWFGLVVMTIDSTVRARRSR